MSGLGPTLDSDYGLAKALHSRAGRTHLGSGLPAPCPTYVHGWFLGLSVAAAGSVQAVSEACLQRNGSFVGQQGAYLPRQRPSQESTTSADVLDEDRRVSERPGSGPAGSVVEIAAAFPAPGCAHCPGCFRGSDGAEVFSGNSSSHFAEFKVSLQHAWCPGSSHNQPRPMSSQDSLTVIISLDPLVLLIGKEGQRGDVAWQRPSSRWGRERRERERG